MTRRERMMRIFYGGSPDRPAVKLWGASPGREPGHPAYKRVYELALGKTDLFGSVNLSFDVYCGRHKDEFFRTAEEPSGSSGYVDAVSTLNAGGRTLRSVFRKSLEKKHGYTREYMLKEPGDIEALLSLPYAPYPFSPDDYFEAEREMGDAGVVMLGLDNPVHALQRMTGSENLAIWSFERPELILEALEVFSARIRAHARAALENGIRGVFGWVGPEVCIPPLMSPGAFEKYVFDIDKPLADLVHNGGGRVWVHCHGKMKGFLRRFAEMGADVLNPVEPPPMGDVALDEAFDIVGGSMALEGNIESHDVIMGSREDLGEKLRAAVEAGAGRRFILCPCSGYAENAEPSENEIENWLFFIEEGLRLAEECAA